MILGLIEVVLLVERMADQVRFYRDQLGLKVLYPTDVENYDKERWVVLDAGNCKLALRKDEKGGSDSQASRLVFRVDNVGSTREEMTRRGVELRDVQTGTPNIHICDGVDPEGNQFSLEAADD